MGLLLVGCASGGDDTNPSGLPPLGGGGNGGDGVGGDGGSGGSSACQDDCTELVQNPCFMGQCNPKTGACEVVPREDDAPCDDGLFCTMDDHCKDGACVGAPNDCGVPPEDCQESFCDEGGRKCLLSDLADGASCRSENQCLLSPVCDEGQCVGPEVDCFFFPVDDCHVGQCNPESGECEPVPANEGTDCTGDDLCLVGGSCDGGTCNGTPKDCTGLIDACNDVGCQPESGTCFKIPKASGTLCPSGTCDLFGQCQPN